MGSAPKVSNPTPPAAPTAGENMQDWIQNYPAMFELQQKYAPMEAQQQVELAQQYAAPLGQAMYAAQKEMYPETSAIQENLAQQSLAGMQSGVPDWQRAQYLSDVNANLGANVGSGIGSDYVSRGLMQQQQDWQNYYRDLGLSTAGRQPLAQPNTPGYSNYASTYTPGQVANTNSQNYGNFSNAYSSMYGANAQLAGQTYSSNMGLIGSGLGMMGTIGGGFAASSARYKTNIKLWA